MKYFFTLCLILAALEIAVAQTPITFPEAGMKQGVIFYAGSGTPNPGATSDISYAYVGDTLIDGVEYSKFSGAIFNDFFTTYEDRVIRKYRSSVLNDTLVLYGEKILYDFNLTVGDVFDSPSFEMDNPTVILDSIYTLQNGETRKYLELDNGNIVYRWVDGIGDLDYGFDRAWDFEGGRTELVCHQNFDELIFLSELYTTEACDFYTAQLTDIKLEPAFKEINLSIYPNPAMNVINIDHLPKSDMKLEIVNSLGQVIRILRTESKVFLELSIMDLTKGYYFIRISDQDKRGISSFIKL